MRSLACVLMVWMGAQAVAQEQPPDPGTDGYDWMQFKNGEWLKGDIKDLQDEDFVFDSDELDEQKLDLDDIQQVISTRTNTVLRSDQRVYQGQIQIDGDSITVLTDEGPVTFPRDEIRSIVPGEPSEWNYWSGKVSVGATVLRGNTDQTDLSGNFKLQRRDLTSRLTLEYNGAWGAVDGDTTTNNHRALINYDYYLTDKLFLRVPRVVVFSDEFQNIAYRITPSVGVGYDVIDTSRWEWSVLGGVGWEYTKFDDTQTGDPTDQNSAALIGSTRVSWEATSRIDLGFEFDITLPVPEATDFNSRAALTGEFEVYSDFDIDVQLIWDRNNNPAPLADGSVPDKDDFRLFVGLGWNF